MTKLPDDEGRGVGARPAVGSTYPENSLSAAGFPPTSPPPTTARGTAAGAPSSYSSTANREMSRLLCSVASGLLASQWLAWWPALLVALVVYFASRIGGE